MRLRLLAAVTAAALVALAFPSAARASHSWSNYHWARTANPFTLKLDNNVTSTWTSYLSLASSDWTSSSVLNTTVVAGSFGSKTSCTPTAGHVEVCNASYGSTGWLGIASISITTGNHISSAFVKVNDTYFSQAQYNTVAYRRLVMCQEDTPSAWTIRTPTRRTRTWAPVWTTRRTRPDLRATSTPTRTTTHSL